MNDDDEEEEIDEDKIDDEEIRVTKCIPGLTERYLVNLKLRKKFEKKKQNFSLMYGEWHPPTCCSITISFVQFILTITMIYIINGKPQVYW